MSPRTWKPRPDWYQPGLSRECWHEMLYLGMSLPPDELRTEPQHMPANPKITDLADFEDPTFTPAMIQSWAQDDDGGNLIPASARAFTEWLDTGWNDYDDASGALTNEDILTSALATWTGRVD